MPGALPLRRLTHYPVAFLASFLILSCGSDGGGESPTQPDNPKATSITLSSTSISFDALGATQQLSATVSDQYGATMSGVPISWNSSSQTVASVDASGLVTAEGNGSATITATAGQASASASVTSFFSEDDLCSAQSEIPALECEALVTLYDDTNGPGWTNNTDWLGTATPCSWYGVSCAGGSVSGVELGGNQLDGTIPTELGGLANLTELVLEENELAGPIPGTLSNLSGLSELNLRKNELSGPIPPGFGDLILLQALFLGGNQLNGTIPDELGNLTALGGFGLSGNQLSGAVPLSFAQLAGKEPLSSGCWIKPPGNETVFMPDTPAYRTADVDGDGRICGITLAG